MSTEKLREMLQEIEGRAEKATPGPWEWWVGNPWHAVAPNHPLRDGNPPNVFRTGDSGDGFFYKPGVQQQAKLDTAFIAAARTDVPWLCARLKIAVEALEKGDSLGGIWDSDATEALARIAEIREAGEGKEKP